jgi:endonuclease III
MPRLGNPTDPLDDLVFVVLSGKTSPETASVVYERLKSAFPAWDQMADSSLRRIEAILKPAGLSRVRGRNLLGTMRRLRADVGKCDLTVLRGASLDIAFEYLVSLPGVSSKVAKCVMMYALGVQVLPVDSHVHRVAARLGWTARKRADQCDDELQALVPPRMRLAFHVDCIAHGRAICRPTAPACHRCPIHDDCPYVAARGR